MGVFERGEGVLIPGISLTNGLIQADHDTKIVGAEKDEKKKFTTIIRYNYLCINGCMTFYYLY